MNHRNSNLFNILVCDSWSVAQVKVRASCSYALDSNARQSLSWKLINNSCQICFLKMLYVSCMAFGNEKIKYLSVAERG